MCSRYYIDDEITRKIRRLAREIDINLHSKSLGDVHPSQSAMVLTGRENGIRLEEMRWGFPKYQGTGLVINARAETAREKKMFRDSILYRRCVIPAKSFYEWDAEKNKVTFFRENEPILYMAGFYNSFQEELRFVILTTEANPSVRSVHDRMPLILDEEDLQDWLGNDPFPDAVLRKTPAPLSRYREYEQQSLFPI